MLEDAQAAGAEGHETKPLPVEVSVFFEISRYIGDDGDVHDHEINKINGRSLRESRIVVLRSHIIRYRAVLEPESAEGNAGSLEVPVRHRKG